MLVQSVNNKYNQNFSMNYRLSKDSVKAIESATGLTYEEMTHLSFDECNRLMKERGKLKEPSKFKLWLSEKYKIFGERFGLLKKNYNIYTDVD